jgi:arylsulfatase A-like enzyme
VNEQTPRRPNVVVILADDMGYGDFAFLNGQASSTPQLDDLAQDSMLFTQAYSASPVCAPARAALLTGRYPQRAGVIDTLEARGTDRLALDETTIADSLRAGGYRTGLVGKWHTGAIGEEYSPINRGFDEFTGFRGGWQDYWNWHLETNGVPWRSDGRYLTEVLADEAAAFIFRNAAEPFFLHVAFNAPHFPFQAPADAIERHRAPGRTERVATIYAMIEIMDQGVGRIRQALSDAGVAENTLVIFTSDNGPDFGGAGEESAERFNAGLAGQKQYVYEGGIRLPLLAHWPAAIQPGQSHQFVHLTDWYPTLLDVTGIPAIGTLPLDGRNVQPALLGGAIDTGPRFWQWTRYEPSPISNAAMREGSWKLVRPAIQGTFDLTPEDQFIDIDIKSHPQRYPTIENGRRPSIVPVRQAPTQLFDLDADPGENVDLAASRPEVVSRMENALDNWFNDVERERRTRSVLPRTEAS